MVKLVLLLGIGALLTAIILPGIYGAYLAFKASIILGIVVLIVEPTPTIIGWVAILGRADACEKLVAWIGLPF